MKILFLFICLFSFSKVLAFNIDMDNILVDNRAKEIIVPLNKQYKIDIKDFSDEVEVNEDISLLARDIVKVLFSKDKIDKKKEITKYLFLSSTSGSDTLAGRLLIDMFIDNIDKDKLIINSIRDIRVVKKDKDDLMVFLYAPSSSIKNKNESLVIGLWLKKNKGGSYKLYVPWYSTSKDINDYFKDVSIKEDKRDVIGGSYNKIGGKSNYVVSDEKLSSMYDSHKDQVVQITGMDGTGSNMYGSGFYLRGGVVVTTWSLFNKFLSKSNYIYINDVYGNTYNVLGVVAAELDMDVVLLKIDKNSGTGVKIGDASRLRSDSPLFKINSRNNQGFSVSYGTHLSYYKGRLSNLFLMSESDVGSVLFDESGNAVGITSGTKLNGDLSYANSTYYLRDIQDLLNKEDYTNIKYILLDTFKENYYLGNNEEVTYNEVTIEHYNKFPNVGNIVSKIKLPLIKGSYKDNIISLRFKSDLNSMIDGTLLISSYTDYLLDNGFSLTYVDNYKQIYKDKHTKVIIKDNLNYLIVLVMEN